MNMKQEENKDFRENEQNVNSAENAAEESFEVGKEKRKKAIEAASFIATGAAVAGGVVIGMETSPDDQGIVTPGEPLAMAEVENPILQETPVANPDMSKNSEPEVVKPSKSEVAEPSESDTMDTSDEVKGQQDETTGEKEEVSEEEGTDTLDDTGEIPIIDVDETGEEMIAMEKIDIDNSLQGVRISGSLETNVDEALDLPKEFIVDPEIPKITETNTQTELANQEKDIVNAEDADNRIFSMKERTTLQDGDTEIPAVIIIDKEGTEFYLTDKDGDGLYESIFDSNGKYIDQAKGGITESDIDNGLEEFHQKYEDFVDGPSVSDELFYDENDSIADEIEELDLGDTDMA
jgi:hypothetical protein